jgi:hypothetical protein
MALRGPSDVYPYRPTEQRHSASAHEGEPVPSGLFVPIREEARSSADASRIHGAAD